MQCIVYRDTEGRRITTVPELKREIGQTNRSQRVMTSQRTCCYPLCSSFRVEFVRAGNSLRYLCQQPNDVFQLGLSRAQ